jgi:hypothetical protein
MRELAAFIMPKECSTLLREVILASKCPRVALGVVIIASIGLSLTSFQGPTRRPRTATYWTSAVNIHHEVKRQYNVVWMGKGRCEPGYLAISSLACGSRHATFLGCWLVGRPNASLSSKVVCAREPWQTKVYGFILPNQRYKLAEFSSTTPEGLPWVIELVDNIYCAEFDGSTSSVGKYVVRYFCNSPSHIGLLEGTLEKHGAAWSILTAVPNVRTFSYHMGSRVNILKQWYFINRTDS